MSETPPKPPTGPARRLREWIGVLATSGLAAAITGAATIIIAQTNGSSSVEIKRCELAAAVLQDESPSPYLDVDGRRRVVVAALSRFEVCMRGASHA